MRSLFGLLLAVSLGIGCTRANPNAFSLPVQDLATPPLNGGGGGGVGVGGGGAAGGGGSDVDLAVAVHDLSVLPPDLRDPLEGVKCGTNLTCSAVPKELCCVGGGGNGDSCISDNSTCPMGDSTYSCDGPEDCTDNVAEPTCCATGANTANAGAKGATCGTPNNLACVPLCHAFADCPTFAGYSACCAVANTPVSRCSRTPCK
jgi:hypothetical protein